MDRIYNAEPSPDARIDPEGLKRARAVAFAEIGNPGMADLCMLAYIDPEDPYTNMILKRLEES
jgi:hypothetical protein